MNKKTAENSTSESGFKSFFKKVGSIIAKWFKTFGAYIVSFLLIILGIFTAKEIGKAVVKKDQKKKDEAKDNAESIVDSIETVEKETEETKIAVEELKQEIIEDKKESEKQNDEYVKKQKAKAESLGFVKK